MGEVRRVIRDASPTVTFLCSPNNPTGLEEPEANVRGVLSLAPGLLVVDEAYGQFASWSAMGLVDDELPMPARARFWIATNGAERAGGKLPAHRYRHALADGKVGAGEHAAVALNWREGIAGQAQPTTR